MRKILLLGASGQLGQQIIRNNTEFDLICPSRTACDIADYKSLSTFCDETPDIGLVINCAAYTDVGRAEIYESEARGVNENGASNIGRCCRLQNIPLIHISTDYVFDGKKKGGYTETDKVSPLNIYGASKAAGEESIKARIENYIILRTSWLLGAYGKNFLKTIVSLAREKQELEITNDQYGSPTPTYDLAETILKISADILDESKNVKWGIYHYGGAPTASWYDLATEIVRQAKEREICPLSVKVTPISSSDYVSHVTRPAHSELLCDKIAANFGIQKPDWKKGISRDLETLFPSA